MFTVVDQTEIAFERSQLEQTGQSVIMTSVVYETLF